MFYKLALNNVKRSVKDYTVYFLTLAFGVCLFYVFNSIESQQAMMETSDLQKQMLAGASTIFGALSVFISIVLGCLILYANTFLIKRRKKELGLYLLMGTSKGKVSRMLIFETFIIGIVALFCGLLLGVLASQGLAVITAKMFVAKLESFHFIFSADAMIKTLIYFGVIFIVVMIFNVALIGKYRLIDLLHGSKKGEKVRISNLWVNMVVFFISLCCLGYAYYLIEQNKLMSADWQQNLSLLLGIVGTFLFFLSLSGFLLKVLRSSKRFYYSGLNMFVLRQLSSKITSTFVSLSIICLMLFISISTISFGFAIADMVTKEMDGTCPYDATLYMYNESDDLSLPEDIVKDSIPVHVYQVDDLKQIDVMRDLPSDITSMMSSSLERLPVSAIPLSEYNQVLQSQNQEPISLSDDEYIINASFEKVIPAINNFLQQGDAALSIGGKELHAAKDSVSNITLYNQDSSSDIGTLILPDEVCENLTPFHTYINVEYIQSNHDYEDAFTEYMAHHLAIYPFTRISNMESVSAGKTLISYVTLYIGIVFIISAAAILALQQLSESSDNLQRYTILRRLGAKDSQINHALLMQISVYFLAPLLLAIVHACVGVHAISGAVGAFLSNLWQSLWIMLGFLLVVYGGYFLATYFSAKAMIREKNRY